MPEKITLDPIQYTQGLYNIAFQICVRGEDVGRMKLLLDGLMVLKQSLVPTQDEPKNETEEG